MAPYLRPSLSAIAFCVSRASAAAGLKRFRQPADFLLDLVGGDVLMRDAKPLGVQNQGRSQGDAVRDRDAAQNLHCFS